MVTRRRLARAAGLVVTLAAILGAPATALADCAAPLPPEQAVEVQEWVFVGTVASVDAKGFSADVRVEEVWRGDVAGRVVVDGGVNPGNPAEDDRAFEVGVRYLFMPSLVDGHFVDSLCGPTAAWEDGFEALRPASAGGPGAGTSTGPDPLGGLVMPIATALVVGGAALALAVFVARRRTE